MAVKLLELYLEPEVKDEVQESYRILKPEYCDKAQINLKLNRKNFEINGDLMYLYYPGQLLISNLEEENFRLFLRRPEITKLKHFGNLNFAQVLNGIELYRKFRISENEVAQNAIKLHFLDNQYKINVIKVGENLLYSR